MDIFFHSKKLQKKFNSEKEMIKEWGPELSKKLRLRLMQIQAVSCLEDLFYLPGTRCHQLSGNRDNQFAVDLKHPYRLVFEPNHDPVPLKGDGGFDIGRITSILILEVVDYHGN